LGLGVRLVLRVLGFPVASLTVERIEYEEEETEEAVIAGGSAHDFERDANPITPEDRYNWEWEDKRGFGFR